MEVNLDNSCFLCLRKSPSSIVKREDDLEDNLFLERISLLTINKYLELNINWKENGVKQVSMCQDCSHVASRLSLLCKQLIEIQMKINISLDQFHRKFEEEENELGTLSRDVRLHRKHIISKCKRKLDLVPHPIIQLGKKLELAPPSSPKKQVVQVKTEQGPLTLQDGPLENYTPVTIANSQPIELEQEIPKIEHVNDFEADWVEDSMSPSPSSPCEPPPLSPLPPPPPLKKRRPPPKVKSCAKNAASFPCKKCDLRFPSKWERRQHAHVHRLPRTLNKKGPESGITRTCHLCPSPKPTFYGKAELERHSHIFHLDHLFVSSKLMETPSPAIFAEYCKHVIHIEGLLSRKGPSTYICNYCGRSFSTWKKLHPHLLYNHKERLAHKLEELQRTTPPSELKKVTLPPVRDEKKCKDCGATFSQAHSLQRHRRESCPLRTDKSVSTAKPCKCPDCGMRFPHTATFYRHRRNRHPESTKPPIFLKQ